MPNDNVTKLIEPKALEDALTEVLLDVARVLLAQAIEAKVAEFGRVPRQASGRQD